MMKINIVKYYKIDSIHVDDKCKNYSNIFNNCLNNLLLKKLFDSNTSNYCSNHIYYDYLETFKFNSLEELKEIEDKKNIYRINIENYEGNKLDLCMNDFKNLRILYINQCEDLEELPDISDLEYLQVLICMYTNIKKMPFLSSCSNLIYLNCSFNELDELPSFDKLDNLYLLDCSFNKLTNLPSLINCIKLELLECEFNKLTCLPDLSKCILLKIFNCVNNKLITLNSLDNNVNLEELYCNNNNLIELPPLDNLSNLKILSCFDNNIKSLPRSIIKCKNLILEEGKKKDLSKISNGYIYNENLSELINWVIREKYFYIPIINFYNNLFLKTPYGDLSDFN
jgi:Leucine-rich repeat (LRR) protein